MKKIAIFLLCLILIFGLFACNLNENTSLNVNHEVNNMELLEYLKSNVSINKSLDEIINVFEEMCKTPIEEDLLLSEYGVYDFTGEDLFYYDLVRQYPDGEDEYFQLRVSIMFSPYEENRFLQDTLWSDDSDEKALLALWRAYKDSNPEGSLEEFYQNLMTTNNEAQ